MYEFKNPNPEKLLLKVRVVLERNTVSGGSGQGIIIAERVGWGGGGRVQNYFSTNLHPLTSTSLAVTHMKNTKQPP